MADNKHYQQLTPIQADPQFMRELATVLGGTNVFGEFSPEEVLVLSHYIEAYRADPGAAVFVEGGKAGYMCVVLGGNLDVIKETSKGKSRKITNVMPGTTIGEMSIVDGEPHSATAVATEPTMLAVLSRDKLLLLVQDKPVVGAKVLAKVAELLSQRLRKTNAMLIDYLD